MADKFMKSLTFVEGGDQYYPLPKVTNADNGKVLKVVNGAWSLDEFVVKTLTKIEVTSSPTTVNYTEGDALDLTGLVVTATFSDGSTEDVTSQCIFSPAAGTVLATTDSSISISYTYNGITRSTSQIIAVAVPNWLTFIGNEDYTLKTYNTTKNWNGTLEYSTDTSTWSTWDGTEISSAGGKLYLRGTGNTKITGDSSNYRFVFAGTDALKIDCEGNIENLLDYETVAAGNHPTMDNYCYRYMFHGCTSLTTAPSLPATTLTISCYSRMFDSCTSLTTAPALPATTLTISCYNSMFWGCASLASAPELPATTLANSCYSNMFGSCTSLASAPALPATTLADYCYQSMFWGCTALTTAPVLPATTLTIYCYQDMFEGCTSLTTAPALPATTLADYCYSRMFDSCTSLTTVPSLPATTLANKCYQKMFYGCSLIKLSTSKTGAYTTAYRIPKSGTGTNTSSALTDMFINTGGTFKGTPSINTTYYTSNTVV